MKRPMDKQLKYFLVSLMCFASFQYGRIHDEGIKVNQPEYNHVVYVDNCEIVCDTTGNINCIWYRNNAYTIDTNSLENL